MDAITSVAIAAFVAFLFVSRVRYLASQALPLAVGLGVDVRTVTVVAVVVLMFSSSSGGATYVACRLASDCDARLSLAPEAWRAIQLVLILVSGAALEEVLFRGFLLNSLVGKVGATQANVCQAAAFAALHLAVYRDVAVLATIAVLGYLLGGLALSKRSVWVPVVFHAAWNVGAVLISVPFDAASWLSRSDVLAFSPIVRIEMVSIPLDVASRTISVVTGRWVAITSSLILMALAYGLVRHLLRQKES